jgi:DNA-binding beta-propeller fold protein YncE
MKALTAPRVVAAVAVVLLAVLVIAGCGSEEGFPPPAEPAASPEASDDLPGIVVDLPGEAEGVVADPRTGIVAVSVRDPDKLLLVSDLVPPRPENGEILGLSGPVWQEVEVPEAARHMQLAAPGGPILTTAEHTDDLLEVALPGGRVTKTRVGDFPHDATQADDGRVFVADEGGDAVSVGEDGSVEATLPAPEQPGGIAASGDSVGVIAVAERVLATWDADTLAPTGEIEAGVGPTHVVAGPDGRFYVADTEGDAILVFEPGPDPRLLDRANVPGSPYGIAVDPRSEMLWVTQTARNRVVGFELTDLAPKRVVSYATVRQPNTVAVDPATGIVYVAGRSDGELQAIDPSREPGDA